ncbi:hypothetical protein B0H16DRAFT_1731995 [Mycena metata]|uniref:Uncharacterized protein n=1 Tax=Mycena metata TaxID=1033252 RepID=A0AAD7MUT1_9AGAR|nr:hypothetical protein B0H16DRAFT_1731995 [Mycena metata]
MPYTPSPNAYTTMPNTAMPNTTLSNAKLSNTTTSNALGTAGEVIRIVVEPDTLVIIGGTATGSVTQRVTVLGVLGEEKKWVLSGENNILTVEGSEDPCLTFPPSDKKASYILLFESDTGGSDFNDAEVAPDYKANKHIVEGFATYYTFHAEQGDDQDYHDITLSVVLIGATKPGVGPSTNGY